MRRNAPLAVYLLARRNVPSLERRFRDGPTCVSCGMRLLFPDEGRKFYGRLQCANCKADRLQFVLLTMAPLRKAVD